MKCERVRKFLVEFEDTPLSSEIAKHLDQCTACRQHSLQMETVRRLLSLKKYERPDPGFEERSALAIHRRIEDLNRPSQSWRSDFWVFLTDYPQPLFRYALAATVAILLAVHFISMPQLAPIRFAEPVARSMPTTAPGSAVIPFEVYRQPSLAEMQIPSNHGPTRIEYGPLEAVPVNFEY
jgi:hypothetical protein